MNSYEQARHEFETGRWSKAYRLFRQALKEEATPVRDRNGAHVLMARCLSQLGRPDEAAAALCEVKDQLAEGDRELLQQFGIAWQEVEDTRRLSRAELEARRKRANG